MSSTYTAYTVIGVRLRQDQLVRSREVRGCMCHRDNTNTPYCPHCGKPTWKQHTYTILKSDDAGNLTANIKMVEPWHQAEECFLGMVFSSDHEPHHGICCNFVHVPADKVVRDVLADLKALLEPHKLWDEREFGIYTFVGVS